MRKVNLKAISTIATLTLLLPYGLTAEEQKRNCDRFLAPEYAHALTFLKTVSPEESIITEFLTHYQNYIRKEEEALGVLYTYSYLEHQSPETWQAEKARMLENLDSDYKAVLVRFAKILQINHKAANIEKELGDLFFCKHQLK